MDAERRQGRLQFGIAELLSRERLVRRESRLFERVRERIVADVVQQRSQPHEHDLFLRYAVQLATLGQQRQCAAREVMGSQRVLEACVCGAWIDEVGMSQLPYVAQPLERRAVDHAQRRRVNADVVPERIPDHLEVAGDRHGSSCLAARAGRTHG